MAKLIPPPKLKPCPFCGSEARVGQWTGTIKPNASWVECPKCYIMTDTYYGLTPEMAKAKAIRV